MDTRSPPSPRRVPAVSPAAGAAFVYSVDGRRGAGQIGETVNLSRARLPAVPVVSSSAWPVPLCSQALGIF